MSDEEDYMSDKFLNPRVDVDIRPGLLRSHADKRDFQALKRKQEYDDLNRKKNPNIKVLELEKRKEGLEKPIEQNNKGFALLQKMGYKPGGSIGKSENGRTEPIPIELKSDRGGLGRSQQKKDYELQQVREASRNTVSASEYRTRIIEQNIQKQIKIDLRKSQRACENLDVGNNIPEPIEKWYWLSRDSEEEKNHNSKKKRKTKEYTNESNYSDDEFRRNDEPDSSCGEISSSEDEQYLDDEESPLSMYNDEERLKSITLYLRKKYFYCIWCSVKYEDDQDMSQNCPGDTNDSH